MQQSGSKQISVQLPKDIIERAQKKAQITRRPDGLKVSVSAVIREWVMKGASCERA